MFIDSRRSHVSGNERSRDSGRVDRSDLSEYASGAHHHERSFQQKDAHPKVQSPGYRFKLNYSPILNGVIYILFNYNAVIWNPWIEKAREMADFGDDEYPNMVCVEAGHVSAPVVLLPGTAYEASEILQVM